MNLLESFDEDDGRWLRWLWWCRRRRRRRLRRSLCFDWIQFSYIVSYSCVPKSIAREEAYQEVKVEQKENAVKWTTTTAVK